MDYNMGTLAESGPQPTVQMSPAEIEIAVRDHHASLCDKYYEELNSHYKLEKSLLVTLTLAFRAAAADTANRSQYLAFRAHFINAHLCSRSKVRRYDILRWYKQELVPATLRSIVYQLSLHYAKECALRYRLAKREGFERGYAMTDEDEQWALAPWLRRTRHYGFELHSPDIDVFTPRFESNPLYLARYLTACLEIRILLIQRMVMRGSGFPFRQFDGGHARKVALWLTDALVYLERTTPLVPVLTEVMSRVERFHKELRRIGLIALDMCQLVQKNNTNLSQKMAHPFFAGRVGLMQDRYMEILSQI